MEICYAHWSPPSNWSHTSNRNTWMDGRDWWRCGTGINQRNRIVPPMRWKQRETDKQGNLIKEGALRNLMPQTQN